MRPGSEPGPRWLDAGPPGIEELTSTSRTASPGAAEAELRRAIGEDAGPQPQRPEGGPDVHGLAEELGLT
jgi:hypothetical protein